VLLPNQDGLSVYTESVRFSQGDRYHVPSIPNLGYLRCIHLLNIPTVHS
jgi:hypothetical protein